MKLTDNLEEAIKKNLNFIADAEMHDRILDDILNAQEKSKSEHSAVTRPNLRRQIMRSPIPKLTAAAVIMIALIVCISHFGGSVESVAWADVMERFESVPFFNVTMYVGNDISGEAKKIEIWKSENSQVRAREGNKIIFGDLSDENNEFVAFDSSTLQPADANGIAKAVLLSILCRKGERFSLKNILTGLPSEDIDVSAVETLDNVVLRETVLFKAKHKTRPKQWASIWALRESKLPIRIHFRSGSKYCDYLFNYSEKKDAAFFDPSIFKSQQTDKQGTRP